MPPHNPEDDPGTWDTRAIAVLCRFLNSGYPVPVGTHEHAFTIVGYRREVRDGQAWIGFIRHDDQRGPYLEVDNILDDVDPGTGHRHSPWQLLLAPVPDKLWLLPGIASPGSFHPVSKREGRFDVGPVVGEEPTPGGFPFAFFGGEGDNTADRPPRACARSGPLEQVVAPLTGHRFGDVRSCRGTSETS